MKNCIICIFLQYLELKKKEMEREQLPPEKLKIMKLPPMKVRRVLLLMSNLLPPHNRGIFDIVEDKTGILG